MFLRDGVSIVIGLICGLGSRNWPEDFIPGLCVFVSGCYYFLSMDFNYSALMTFQYLFCS